jgi:hypothetical protein
MSSCAEGQPAKKKSYFRALSSPSSLGLGESELGLHPASRRPATSATTLGRNTIKRILQAHGLELAPSRSKRMSWKTFRKAAGQIWMRSHLPWLGTLGALPGANKQS